MFEWLCSIGMIWGLLITGMGVIVGLCMLIAAGVWTAIGVGALWDKIPYRITEPAEKVLRGIRIAVVTVFLLIGLSVIALIVYSEICPNAF